jgi:hypothetical protein
MIHPKTALTIACLIIAVRAIPAAAQATSFDQLQPTAAIVKIGEAVEITETSGNKIHAKIDGAAAGTLRVIVNGKPRDFSEPEVQRIRRTLGTHAATGAKAGLVGGAIFGVAAAGVVCAKEREACGPLFAIGIPVYGAIGSGIGAVVGLLIPRRETIFERKLKISPILNKDAKGARIAFSF